VISISDLITLLEILKMAEVPGLTGPGEVPLTGTSRDQINTLAVLTVDPAPKMLF
jgi:hypothetical protein